MKNHQASLFTPTTTIIEDPGPEQSETPEQRPAEHSGSSLNIEITREELSRQIITSMVHGHRWEKQRALGASDEELAASFGISWIHYETMDVHFNVEPAPTATCTSHTGKLLLTLDGAEIANLVRTLAEIPPLPAPEERERLLKQQLAKERLTARNEMFTAVQGIIQDKARKRAQGFTQQFVDLLFTQDCLEDKTEGETLLAIAGLLVQRGWATIKAMKAALQIVERAHLTWQSIEGYWLDRPYF